jgi:hypothetical protein
MLRSPALSLPVLLLLLLGACTSTPAPPQSAPVKPVVIVPAPVRAPVRRAPPKAQALVAPGLEGVIGATREDLVSQFGAARLDVWEGDARKLQFIGTACVLDVYLYPAAPGSEPEASYVDARRPSDGQDVDRAACIAALRSR